MYWNLYFAAIPIIQLDLVSILSIVLGSGSLSTIGSAIILERLRTKWKLESDRTIEALKGEISQNNSLVNSLVVHSGQVRQKIIERQLDSIKTLWQCTMTVKDNTPALISTVNNIFTHDEVASGGLKHKRRGSTFEQEILDIDKAEYFAIAYKNLQNVHTLRPFIGPRLFVLFNAYNAGVGRMVFLLTNGVEKDSIVTWNKDHGIEQILNSVLEANEVEFLLNGSGINGFNALVDLMEQKILNEIEVLLSGKSLVADAISISGQIGAISKAKQEEERKEITEEN